VSHLILFWTLIIVWTALLILPTLNLFFLLRKNAEGRRSHAEGHRPEVPRRAAGGKRKAILEVARPEVPRRAAKRP
jgi:hypothetical protein